MVVRPKHYGALRNDLSHQIFCMQTDILGSSRINVRYWRTYSSGRNGNRSGAVSMIETTITLWPQVVYVKKRIKRFFSGWPGWFKKPLTWTWPEEWYTTMDELVENLDQVLDILSPFFSDIPTGTQPGYLSCQPLFCRVSG